MRLRTANNHKRRAEHNRRSRAWRDKIEHFSGGLRSHQVASAASILSSENLGHAFGRFAMGGRMMGKTLEMTHLSISEGPKYVDVTTHADFPIRRRVRVR